MTAISDDRIIREVAARVPELSQAMDLNVTGLVGGLTNRNYLVDANGARFVIRIAGENGPLLGVDRAREKEVLGIVTAAGVTPHVAAFILPEGHSATLFIADAHALSIDEFTSHAMVPRLAAKLRDHWDSEGVIEVCDGRRGAKMLKLKDNLATSPQPRPADEAKSGEPDLASSPPLYKGGEEGEVPGPYHDKD